MESDSAIGGCFGDCYFDGDFDGGGFSGCGHGGWGAGSPAGPLGGCDDVDGSTGDRGACRILGGLGMSRVCRARNPKSEIRNPKSKTRRAELETGNSRGGVIAFDTGPGNMVMDAVVALASGGKLRFDGGGRLAAKGQLDEQALSEAAEASLFFQRQLTPEVDRPRGFFWRWPLRRSAFLEVSQGKTEDPNIENLLHYPRRV